VLVAGRAVWFYLGKLAWPADLVFYYPRWELHAAAWGPWLYPAAALGLGAALVGLAARGRRAPLAALLYFCGTLFPVLGFVDVYPFAITYVADHFQYFACLGPLALAAACPLPAALGATGRRAAGAAAAGVLVLLAGLTWRQGRLYQDAATLYSATLEGNPRCWLAHHNLGNLLLEEGRAAEAIGHYEAALRENPRDPDIPFNFGRALLQERRPAEAAAQFEAVLARNPDDAEAHDNLGSALLQLGRTAEAVTQLRSATRLAPDNGVAHYNLGVALQAAGQPAEAQAEFAAAARLGVHP